ncbi:hypothetical protein R6Q57_012515 [Mikania cordata]
MAKEWKEMLLADDKIWDQNGFNDLVHKQLGPSVDDESGLVYAYDGTLKLGLLPASIFCNGHTYFVQAMYQQLRLEPYAVHTTFQYAGTEGKRHRLREAMAFYDPPEYYDSPGGFLTFKPSIPKSLLLDREHSLQTHFTLVNYQVHTMLKALPTEEFGPGINIREYSFFDNSLMPAQVKESWLDVQLCQEGSENCQSNITNTTGVLRFPKHSNEETLKTVFTPLKNVKVIQFSSMQDAFLGFTDKASNLSLFFIFNLSCGFLNKNIIWSHITREEKFRKRVKRYVGIWCCVDAHNPGHIYYDMYWDEKPDWKPLPPQTPEDDRPGW